MQSQPINTLSTEDKSGNKKSFGAIEFDPFIRTFLNSIPVEVANSFTKEQLLQIKLNYGSQSQTNHIIDQRSVFGFSRWTYYCVFLFGRNRRELTHAEKKVNAAGKLFFIFIFSLMLFGCVTLSLYLLKSFLGIDIMPNFSLGLWTWLNS